MATQRLKKRERRDDWASLDLRTQFILGQGIDPRGDLSEAEIRDAFREFEDIIVADHISRYPGTRPRSWWKWSAPEPRRKIGTQPLYATPTQSRYYDAASDSIQSCRPGDVIGTEDVYESERDYLARLGLLLPGELEGTA